MDVDQIIDVGLGVMIIKILLIMQNNQDKNGVTLQIDREKVKIQYRNCLPVDVHLEFNAKDIKHVIRNVIMIV
jgi:hypothetical protein